jgi:hypothetical protein
MPNMLPVTDNMIAIDTTNSTNENPRAEHLVTASTDPLH